MIDFTELEVWKESRKLANDTYTTTRNFPREEIYGLTSQLRRCAVSVVSNIAEGCGRRTNNDTIHFLHIARGSLYELETQVYISLDQNFIQKEDFDSLISQILSCKKLINGFIKYFKSK